MCPSPSKRLVTAYQTASVSAAHAAHCATYCRPCRPLIGAMSRWMRTSPPTPPPKNKELYREAEHQQEGNAHSTALARTNRHCRILFILQRPGTLRGPRSAQEMLWATGFDPLPRLFMSLFLSPSCHVADWCASRPLKGAANTY